MDWNELEYLSWDEFKQMAPSIIQLEISRIGKLIDALHADMDFRNTLVRARFALKQFVECLEKTESAPLHETCTDHLRSAILALTAATINRRKEDMNTLNYILDRLNDILNKSGMLY